MIIIRSDADWVALVGSLRVDRPTASLGEIAATLGVSDSMLNHILAMRRKMPMACKIRLLDALGHTITRGELAGMMPANARQALSESDRSRSEEGFMEAWGD